MWVKILLVGVLLIALVMTITSAIHAAAPYLAVAVVLTLIYFSMKQLFLREPSDQGGNKQQPRRKGPE